MRFHDLRHMNASVMLQLGVPDKYAMERGGWSTDSTLKQVYQHTFDEKRNEIDSQIDDYFNKLL
jgi:integrase